MAVAQRSGGAEEMFLRAEQSGLKLASIGRIAALALLAVWLISTRADDPTRALGYVLVLSLFAILGLAHYALIGTRFDTRWVKYVFITLDIPIVSALVPTQPLYRSEEHTSELQSRLHLECRLLL